MDDQKLPLVLVGCIVALGFLLHWLLLHRLRTKHGSIWIELGKPTFIANNSIQTNRSLRRFLKSPEARMTGDHFLSRLVSVNRWYGIIAQLFVLAVIALTAFRIVLGRGQ